MHYLPFPKSYKINSELVLRINSATNSLFNKLTSLDINKLKISDYNKRYLKSYVEELGFYMPIYAQLMAKAIGELRKPIDSSIFVDYGGGCGILSFLAKEIGFETVIYNDIYDVSIADSKIIGNAISLPINQFVCGDISELSAFIKSLELSVDLICSMDVLEHIYSLQSWFNKVSEIEGNFSIVFLTSANSNNPLVVRKLKKMQHIAEYVGRIKTEGWKERDLEKSFLQSRREIIRELAPKLDAERIDFLAKGTRGLIIDDIVAVVKEYLQTGTLGYKILHPSNTCDPYTGNWTENLIDIKYLKNLVTEKGFDVEITNSFYSYSKSKMVNVIKSALNYFMLFFGKGCLFISPSYTLIARKTS